MKTSFLLFFILSVVTLSVVARLDDHPKFRRAATERKVEDEYIVVTKPGALLGSDLGIPVKRFYSKVLNGFSARLSEPMVEKLRDNEAVEYVEEVPILEVSSVQAVSEWGLDRIDQWYGLNNQYRWDYSGEGVTVYIIDTGIWASHTEFGGRASCAKDFVEEAGGNCRDDNGHGTHVAGIVGGATYGVAKDVQIKSLKVCDANGGCNGDVIIEALEYLASAEGRRVGNLSLNTGVRWETGDQAVNAAVEAGVVMVASAGNNGFDACEVSYATANKAIGVGATNSQDKSASFSNYGSCVDIWAPGQGIKSAWRGTQDGMNSQTLVMQGTSQAAAMVSGVAAMLLEKGVSPEDVKLEMRNDAIYGALTGLDEDSPNALLQLPNAPIDTSPPFPSPVPQATAPISLEEKEDTCSQTGKFCFFSLRCCNGQVCSRERGDWFRSCQWPRGFYGTFQQRRTF